MNLPKRRNPRLRNYDYSTPGYYFITVCTKNKKKMLCSIDNNSVITGCDINNVGAVIGRPPTQVLTECGKAVEKAIKNISECYASVEVNKYVIMPNHIHLILIITSSENGRPMAAPTVSGVINQMKGYATKTTGVSLWQRSYHDHIIRGDEDYRKIWEYIDTNPARWKEDCFYTE